MRTFFYAGFRQDPWTPVLGQEVIDTGEAPVTRPGETTTTPSFDLAKLLEAALNVGGQAYSDYIKQEIEDGKIDVEEAKLRVKQAEEAARKAAAGKAGAGEGIPTSYLIAGGIGIAAIIATIALTR